jgi:hypothetical protein
MKVKEFHLYRAKFIKSNQMPLLAKDLTPADIFIEAIRSKPNFNVNETCIWHIGNINYVNELSGSFAVGKTTKSTVEKYDEESGDFIDEVGDLAPYTKVIFDCKIGLLGIAKKSKLAADAKALSRKIGELFENSEIVRDTEVEVKIDQIIDPEGFIEKLKSSYAIKKFKATFTGPNPVDADELFQKPLSVYCKEMGAQSGNLEVQGEALDERVAEAIAHSTAATGNTASARIVRKKDGKSVAIAMKGNAVVVPVDSVSSTGEALALILKRYKEIRGEGFERS